MTLDELRYDARQKNIPIIRDDTMNFLSFILSLKKPSAILEVGTAVGFSAAFMSGYLEPGGSVTTIEKSEHMYYQAYENFEKMGIRNKIKIIAGDAGDVLDKLRQPFDVIFLDGAKAQYVNLLSDCLRLLNIGGILIADDVLQKGNLEKERLEVPRRQRTVHSRMNKFLSDICENDCFVTTVIPIGDGLSLSYRIK